MTLARGCAIALALGACSTLAAPNASAPARDAADLRWHTFPAVARPLAARVVLELDPGKRWFAGEVEHDLELTRATSRLWLHASDLWIHSAELSSADGATTALAFGAAAFGAVELAAASALHPGRATLRVRYHGRVHDREQGLFVRRHDSASYLVSQGQPSFARRFIPCFDEPRWKVPWQVTVIAPAADVVLGNAPLARRVALSDGRVRHELSPTEPLPSYLVAVAVGPFELLALPAAGRAAVPMRLAVPRGQAAAAAVAAELAPRAARAAEELLRLPLPLRKLDWVVVPQFFGGMENPGLIVLDSDLALGATEAGPDRRELASLMVHELAHQWFGNAVTAATWSELWWNEGLATFVANLGSPAVPEIDGALARVQSWQRAMAPGAAGRSLRGRPADPRQLDGSSLVGSEVARDEVIYDKGAALVEALAQWLGHERVLAALRALLVARTHRSVAGEDVALALRGLSPSAPAVLLGQLDLPGSSHARLRVDCAAPERAALEIEVQSARPDVPLPVCVRYDHGRGPVRQCELVVGRARRALAAPGCPVWLAGNDDLRGLYTWHVELPAGHPRALTPWPPEAAQTRAERLGHGGALAARAERGELAAAVAALVESSAPRGAERARLLERAYGELQLIEALDELVADADLPAWRRRKASWAARLWAAAPSLDSAEEIERHVAWRLPDVLGDVAWPADLVDRARAAIASAPTATALTSAWRVALRAADGAAATARLLAALAEAPAPHRAALVSALPAIPASGVAALLSALDTGSAALTWPDAAFALEALLGRRATRAEVLTGLAARRATQLSSRGSFHAALGAACSATERAAAEVLSVARPPRGGGWRARSDECIRRRADAAPALGRALSTAR